MGCDIHMYVEYRREGRDHWSHFGGRINPGRNYLMFGILSEGVRTDPEFTFTPKGMPTDAGYNSSNDNRMYISESKGEDCVDLERATKWVMEGSSKFIPNSEGKDTWVTHPDWHSHSWLSTEEFEKAMGFYRENAPAQEDSEPEYEVLLTAMKRFVELGFECRVVFWFDN